jgi:hypothetical protein
MQIQTQLHASFLNRNVLVTGAASDPATVLDS